MKKFNYFVYAAALTGVLFTSCSKDDDDDNSKSTEKQISAIVYKDYETVGKDDSTVFTYDASGLLIKTEAYSISSPTSRKMFYSMEFNYVNNRLTNYLSYDWESGTKKFEDKDSISYDSNNRPHIIYDFDYTNGKILKSGNTDTIKYDSNELPTKYVFDNDEYETYEITNNNITKVKEYYEGELDQTYTYTFDNKKNPFKANPYFWGEYVYYNSNNFVSSISNTSTKTMTYEYDSEGYPTKITVVGISSGSGSTFTDVMKIYYK